MLRPNVSSIVLFAGIVALAPGLVAQVRSDVEHGSAWPASWNPDAWESHGVTQQERLPVYDDAGVVISLEEIQARVDPDGSLVDGFAVGLVGYLLGSYLGRKIESCGGVRGNLRYFCSPRGEALKSVLSVGLGVVLGTLGAWAGWEGSRTTWDEALAEIRKDRREGAR